MVTACDYAVVDDEPAAHSVIASLMQRHPSFRLVGSYYRAADAESGLEHKPAQLMFLDISMPDASGLELLDRLIANSRVSSPITVLTTAHANKALRAYDLGVRDYLLKPIAQERLDLCIERLLPLLAESQGRNRLMAFSTGNGYRLCNVATIAAIEANGNFSWLVLTDGRIMVSESLKSLHARLAPFGFVRCHKRYLANRSHITDIQTSALRLSNAMSIPIGDIYRSLMKFELL